MSGTFLLVSILWIVISLMVGDYAQDKGHSFVGFFLLAVVASPLIAFIAVLIIDGKQSNQHLDRLQKITELRRAGTLSDEEFEDEKARILASRPA